MTDPKHPVTHASVWTNVFYVLPALLAPAWHSAFAMAFTGTALMLASGAYHATTGRTWQRADVTAMLTYIVALCAALASAWTLWAYVAVPVAAALYWRLTWDIDSFTHVPAWAGLAILLTISRTGVWTALPVGLFAGGWLVRHGSSTHSVWHGLWHVLTAAAVGAALWGI